ncbi:MAG: aminotransferase class I/II-fold pyridoxal phosphate-dependent enzyme [Nanoarchaeota archaeon]|nr:aminotransferase class I/II-fold pyridoxal phosphate-dependent enzyme [Nanoarchaeota archaeon]
MNLEAITTVYSYRFPEVRELIDQVTTPFPHDVFLSATEPTGALDNFDQPIIDKVVDFYAAQADLAQFGFRYPTSGTEEGIREVLTWLQAKGVKQIYVLKGEYEGYKAVGATRCMETVEVPADVNTKTLAPGYFFISNPSARDGNILPNDFINDICEAGHKVFYDMAYLGSTAPHEFDLSHPNIFAAVVSMSKPYGLFYDRIGFTFAKEAVPALYGNKWFKSILGLLIAEKIVDTLEPDTLYNHYRPRQEAIVAGINEDTGLALKPSDALLLAYAREVAPEVQPLVQRFQRGDGYRFCLTPYYRRLEGGR